MLDEKIDKLRKQLNKSIQQEKDYKIIYKLSTKLDKLISEFYCKQTKI